MGKIVISENVSLDGVMQDPTGEEGFRRGGWFTEIGDRDRAAWAAVFEDEAIGAEAMLMGRRSDEWFAERWLSRTGEWAERLNSMPKYVVSSTLDEARWTNSTVLQGRRGRRGVAAQGLARRGHRRQRQRPARAHAARSTTSPTSCG